MAQSSVSGVITEVLNPVTGTSERGTEWFRQTIIVKKFSDSQFERFVALDFKSKDMIETIKPSVGMCGEFFYDADSRKSSKPDQYGAFSWFTSLTCYKVKPYQMASAPMVQNVQQANPVYPQQNPQQPSGWGQQSPQVNPQNNGWNPNGGQQGNGGW